MSFVVDRNLSSWECFDVGTASTLFWKHVPFLHRTGEREDIRESLTVRILSGVTRNNHNLRVLRINISSEVDFLFLHTLEVTEEDFQGLKAEQGILVDFSEFPTKLMTLFEKCIQSSRGEFQAELVTHGGTSCLKIMETNDFNKLPHVSLIFRPGSDQTIKSFLAFRLSEVEKASQSLQLQLGDSETECTSLREELKEKDRMWNALKEKYEAGRLEGRAESKRMLLDVEEQMTRAKEDLKTSLEKEKTVLEEKMQEQIDALKLRNEEQEAENRKLREEKFLLDKKCSEICHRLATAEGMATSLQKSDDELHNANDRLMMEKQQLLVDVSQAKAEIRSLNEKVSAAEQFAELQKTRISDLDANKAQLEKLCEELRSGSLSSDKSLDERATELKEARFVIQKLARDLQGGKERQCNLRAMLSRQEDVVSHQLRQLKETNEEKSLIEQDRQKLTHENKALRSDNDEMRKKLNDSAEQLIENESMIGWLHRQINDSASSQRHQTRSYVRDATTSFALRKSVSGPTGSTMSMVEHA